MCRRLGLIGLFDFSAAFPSISQEFLFKTLEHVGLPANAMNMVRHLYSNASCQIAVGGGSFEGFELAAGVRQGCPLSPLLYAAVAEIILDKVGESCPGVHCYAFADDTALIVEDIWKHGVVLGDHILGVCENFGLGAQHGQVHHHPFGRR